VLDRALDVSAALEVRGFGGARRPPRYRRPYSRHDLLFVAGAAVIAAAAIWARVAGLAPFRAYPSLHAPVTATTVAVAAVVLAAALAPFAERRGIAR
jgi:energy-coupling factor transporter transmembrane protein EcfT